MYLLNARVQNYVSDAAMQLRVQYKNALPNVLPSANLKNCWTDFPNAFFVVYIILRSEDYEGREN